MGVIDDVLREKGKKKKKRKGEGPKESFVSLWNVLGKTKSRKVSKGKKEERRKKKKRVRVYF